MPDSRIVILGGGTAGTWVANRLRRADADAVITVIDSHGNHFYQPGFLDLPFDTADPATLERWEHQLLDRGIILKKGRVETLDLPGRRVLLESKEVLQYDALVIATGARSAPDAIPGFTEAANHFYCLHRAMDLRERLAAWKAGTIVVGASRLPYKCPPSPHEFALRLVDFLKERGLRDSTTVRFIYPAPRIYPHADAAPFFEERLAGAGVSWFAPFTVRDIDPTRREIRSQEGMTLAFDLLVLAPPFRGQPCLRDTAIAGPEGWVRVDPVSLRAAEGVYALGDAADLPVPKSAAAAHYQGKVVVRNVLAELAGTEAPARYDGHFT